MYESETDFARTLVAEACALTRRVQDEVVANADSLTKGDRSPVTLADLTVQAIMGHRLAKRFPLDAFLAEEDSGSLDASPAMTEKVGALVRSVAPDLDDDAIAASLDRGKHPGGSEGRHWVLDPVDGTKGFLRGQQYAIALALVESGKVVVGALGCPNLPAPGERGNGDGWVFFATRSAGAWSTPVFGGESSSRDGRRDPRLESGRRLRIGGGGPRRAFRPGGNRQAARYHRRALSHRLPV